MLVFNFGKEWIYQELKEDCVKGAKSQGPLRAKIQFRDKFVYTKKNNEYGDSITVTLQPKLFHNCDIENLLILHYSTQLFFLRNSQSMLQFWWAIYQRKNMQKKIKNLIFHL